MGKLEPQWHDKVLTTEKKNYVNYVIPIRFPPKILQIYEPNDCAVELAQDCALWNESALRYINTKFYYCCKNISLASVVQWENFWPQETWGREEKFMFSILFSRTTCSAEY